MVQRYCHVEKLNSIYSDIYHSFLRLSSWIVCSLILFHMQTYTVLFNFMQNTFNLRSSRQYRNKSLSAFIYSSIHFITNKVLTSLNYGNSPMQNIPSKTSFKMNKRKKTQFKWQCYLAATEMPELGAGGAIAHPVFCRSVNPI